MPVFTEEAKFVQAFQLTPDNLRNVLLWPDWLGNRYVELSEEANLYKWFVHRGGGIVSEYRDSLFKIDFKEYKIAEAPFFNPCLPILNYPLSYKKSLY